jgi:hypothetical protein
MLRAAPPTARPAVALGIIGAVAPDFDHITTYFFNRTIWPQRFRKFHGVIQKGGSTPMKQELMRAALSSLAVLCVLATRPRP